MGRGIERGRGTVPGGFLLRTGAEGRSRANGGFRGKHEEQTRSKGARGAAEVALEVAAEVRGLGVAQLHRDDLHGLAGGEESGGGGHALALKPFAGRAAEVALAEAFELAQGEAEVAGGGGDVPLGALGEGAPKCFDGRGGGFEAAAGHGWLVPAPAPA